MTLPTKTQRFYCTVRVLYWKGVCLSLRIVYGSKTATSACFILLCSPAQARSWEFSVLSFLLPPCVPDLLPSGCQRFLFWCLPSLLLLRCGVAPCLISSLANPLLPLPCSVAPCPISSMAGTYFPTKILAKVLTSSFQNHAPHQAQWHRRPSRSQTHALAVPPL